MAFDTSFNWHIIHSHLIFASCVYVRLFMYAYYYIRILPSRLPMAMAPPPIPHPIIWGKICMTRILHDQEFVRSCVNSRICSPSSPLLWSDFVHPVIVSC